MEKKHTISVRINSFEFEWLLKIATQESRSMSAQIRHLLHDHMIFWHVPKYKTSKLNK